MSFSSLLNSTVRIEAQASTASTATGYPVHTSTDVGFEACSIQPGASRTLVANDKRSSDITHTGYFAVGASVPPHARLEATEGPFAGRWFRVIGPPMDAAGRGHHLEVPLQEVFP